MQRLEVSGAVRPLYGSLGVKGLKEIILRANFIWAGTCECKALITHSKLPSDGRLLHPSLGNNKESFSNKLT